MGAQNQIIHRMLCDKFPYAHIGHIRNLHPFVVKLMEDSMRTSGSSSAYEQYLKEAASDMHCSEDDIRRLVSRKDFQMFMLNFSAGVQYAAKKIGVPIDVKKYLFRHNLKEYGRDYSEFYAAAMIDDPKRMPPTIVIHPQLITLGCSNPKKDFDYPGLDDRYTLSETATLVGAEEMMHMHQALNHNAQVSYELKPGTLAADDPAYASDPHEVEAKELLKIAAQDLGLGTKNRRNFP